MTDALLTPAVIEEARKRQRKRRNRMYAALLLAVAVTAVAAYMTGFPFDNGSGPAVSFRGGNSGSSQQAPNGGLQSGFHTYTYAQAVAAGLPGVTKYDPQDDPAKCVPNAHWACKGSAMYCPRNDYNWPGYKTAAALDAAIAKAPKTAVCTTDPRDVIYGYGAPEPTYTPLSSSPVGADKFLYRDPTYGWTVTYPSNFDANTSASSNLHSTTRSVSIANFDPSQSALSDMPADGVVFELSHSDGMFVPIGAPGQFPLTLDQFTSRPPVHGSKQRWIAFQVGRAVFTAFVSIGSKASRAYRRAITEIVRSVHFPYESHKLTFGPYSASETIRMRVPRYYKGRQTRIDAENAGFWASRVSSNPVVAGARRFKVPGSYAVIWDIYHPFKFRIVGYAHTPRGADTITTELTESFTAYIHRLMLKGQPRDRWQFITEPLVSATKISHLQPGANPQPFKIRR